MGRLHACYKQVHTCHYHYPLTRPAVLPSSFGLFLQEAWLKLDCVVVKTTLHDVHAYFLIILDVWCLIGDIIDTQISWRLNLLLSLKTVLCVIILLSSWRHFSLFMSSYFSFHHTVVFVASFQSLCVVVFFILSTVVFVALFQSLRVVASYFSKACHHIIFVSLQNAKRCFCINGNPKIRA